MQRKIDLQIIIIIRVAIRVTDTTQITTIIIAGIITITDKDLTAIIEAIINNNVIIIKETLAITRTVIRVIIQVIIAATTMVTVIMATKETTTVKMVIVEPVMMDKRLDNAINVVETAI